MNDPTCTGLGSVGVACTGLGASVLVGATRGVGGISAVARVEPHATSNKDRAASIAVYLIVMVSRSLNLVPDVVYESGSCQDILRRGWG